MSSLDSGMDVFASPLSPLTHMIRGAMPNSLSVQAGGRPGTIGNTGGGSYMKALKMGRGQPTPQGGASGQGPMNDQITMAAMMSAAGLSDDEKSHVKGLKTPQQLKDYLAVRNQAMTQQRQVKPVADMGFGQATQAAQPSIGGLTPPGVAPGSMHISAGAGNRPDRPGLQPMQEADMAQWMDRIGSQLGSGEAVGGSLTGGTPEGMKQPGTVYNELPGVSRFTVSGMNPPAPPQTANPLGQAVQSHLKQFPNSLVPAMQNATPEQVIQQINKERSEGQAQTRQQDTEKRTETRTQHSDQRHQQDEVLHNLQNRQRVAAQMGDKDTVDALQKQIDATINPPQQAAPQPQQPGQGGQPVQIADPAQVAGLPSGTPFTINGHVYRKD